MARNEEKALTLFNKWQTFKKDYHAGEQNRRPLVTAECQSLPEAEKFRRDIVQNISKKIAAIQNASLGEHRVRELNDEINKHMRQKHYWEVRIRELGGSDYRGGKKQFYDVEGKELPGAPHYKYYGVAKDLPGVRELFAEMDDIADKKKLQRNRTRGDLYKNITPDYYGYRDDDDGVLIEKERKAELLRVQESIDEFHSKKRKLEEEVARSGGVYGVEELQKYSDNDPKTSYLVEQEIANDIAAKPINLNMLSTNAQEDNETSSNKILKAHVAVPSQDDIAKVVLEEKKKSLLEKYLL